MLKLSLIFLFLVASTSLLSQTIKDSSIVHEEYVVYYDTDKYELDEDHELALSDLISIVKSETSYLFYVDAHTDDVGTEEYNLELSNRRKDKIVEYLVNHGIDNSKIESNFHGESLRAVFEINAASRQKNRRAIVQLVSKQKFVYVQGEIVDEETQEGIVAEIVIRNDDFENSTKTDAS